MLLRPYDQADAPASLELFMRAVRETASKDYTSEQIDAWADEDRDLAEWDRARAAANTQVVELYGQVVGFIDVSEGGYIDMLYVDPNYGRMGVASALLSWAIAEAQAAGANEMSTFASITARPFFAANEFTVDQERAPVVRGVAMTNFRMSRPPACGAKAQ